MNSIFYSKTIYNQLNENCSFQDLLQFKTNKKYKCQKKQKVVKQSQNLRQRLIDTMQNGNYSLKIPNSNRQLTNHQFGQFFTVKKKSRSRSKTFRQQPSRGIFNEKINQTSKLMFRNNSVQYKVKQPSLEQLASRCDNQVKTPKKNQIINEFLQANDLKKTYNKNNHNLNIQFQKKLYSQQSSKFIQVQKYYLKDSISMVQSIIFNQQKQIQLSDLHIIKSLGEGQYGKVYMVIHKTTHFVCALKIISKNKVKSQKYQQQILRQLKIHSNLDHPNIIPMYGFFDDQKNIYVLMEYCLNMNLNKFTQKLECLRMGQAQLSPMANQLVDGIQYLHRRNIIHRDIKPQNIMLTYGVPKICDFGWSIYNTQQDLTKTKSGTPLYYSPQVVKGQDYDYKIDIWSLGMIFYECLVGKTPFKVYTQNQLHKIVNDPIQFPSYVEIKQTTKILIKSLLQKNPQERISLQVLVNSQFITNHKKKNHQNQYYLDLFFALRQ